MEGSRTAANANSRRLLLSDVLLEMEMVVILNALCH